MLRTVLWIAAACAAVLVAVAVSRSLHFDKPATPPPLAPAETPKPAQEVAATPPAPAPEPPARPAPPLPTPEDLQVQEDAAATGMTTPPPQIQPPPPSQPPN
jgi:hypothetical protein